MSSAQTTRPTPELIGGPVGSDYHWRQGPAELTIEPVSDSHALVTVRWHQGPPDPPKIFATLPLLGATTVKNLARDCAEQVKGFDWLGFFQSSFYQTIRHLRDGDEPINVATVELAPPGFIINPLILDAGETSLIAPGGNGKSFLATAAALSVASGARLFAGYTPQQTGPVLYLDWEATAGVFAYRIARLAKGAGIPVPKEGIHYYHPTQPLSDSARAWERRCAILGIRLVVIDSVMKARGFRNTALGGAPDTGMFYEALNRIGVPALLVDHTAGDDKQAKRGAFGSVVNENSARLQWTMPNPRWQGTVLHTSLHLHKTNNTSRDLPDIHLRVEWDDPAETVKVIRAAATEVPALPVKERVREFLEGGGEGTPTKIASVLGLEAKQVSARLLELRELGVAGSHSGNWYAVAQGTEGLM